VGQGRFEKTKTEGPEETHRMIADEKFAKKERLVKTGEFSKVYKSGGSFANGPFVLKTLPNTLDFTRIGFSISARNVKKASGRNRLRRLFREVFRKNKKILKKGFDTVLVVRKETQNNFSYKDAQGIFLRLAKKANILA